ncbi:MAG: tagatose-6-phosphate ketose isomerase [Acidobacteriia bacterium]|nr:tagatose-6-phosphate ketose isomerase [Terriglobia bacterium]MYG04487.1 tagatose-6-phosphate ketose isomerase [Terriglobia bacterium]MYK12092.1 tagatose-6-phosphate ketose isomerase [Terriglobia bacterium]
MTSAAQKRLFDALDGDAGKQGWRHTLTEIFQQPELWHQTAEFSASVASQRLEQVRRNRFLVFTGSGSSHYVGECIAPAIQRGAGRAAQALGSGELLLAKSDLLPLQRPLMLVSFARSGNSPESTALISDCLEQEPSIEHLVVTCNPSGKLARQWGAGVERRVTVDVLDPRTCDKSLVMTSSFTNLALAGLVLGYAEFPKTYLRHAETLVGVGLELFEGWLDRLESIARQPFARMIALGSGGQFGTARESALKMLEMTDGRVSTQAESWLGFRHGPMCAFRGDCLLLLFVSGEPAKRAYQLDVLREIRHKGLGGTVVAVGRKIPRELLSDGDLLVDPPGLAELPDEWAAIAGTVVGQLLGFFRCLQEGLQPDQPAGSGAISRVVPEFRLYPD